MLAVLSGFTSVFLQLIIMLQEVLAQVIQQRGCGVCERASGIRTDVAILALCFRLDAFRQQRAELNYSGVGNNDIESRNL